MEFLELVQKYNKSVPRYTSYPSVPFWKGLPQRKTWLDSLNKIEPQDSWSLYLHLPFCESLCSFCGCTKIITKNHGKEEAYVQLLADELSLYLENCPALKQIPLRQIHLGGGSPTFFSAESLEKILANIVSKVYIDKNHFEGSVEADPRRTNAEQLKVFKKYGFNRLSLGVQDFDEAVQKTVNRLQPYEMTEKLTLLARDMGFESINFDLIYGLPKQTLSSMEETLKKVIELKPDRVAFYSFAFVPWLKPSQKLFDLEDLPSADLKWRFYLMAQDYFVNAGYCEIGIDHFSLPSDALSHAKKDQRLHRNFMGYTDLKTDYLIGLGLSAISETKDCYHQNLKDLTQYQNAIINKSFATEKGHVLSAGEKIAKEQIQNLMTHFSTELETNQIQALQNELSDFSCDHLIELKKQTLKVLDKGRPFVRNICALLDPYYGGTQDSQFSKTI